LESNWRFNLWEYGMSHSVFKLIARTTTQNPPLLIGALHGDPLFFLTAFVPAPGQLPVFNMSGSSAKPFPYGIPVEPD